MRHNDTEHLSATGTWYLNPVLTPRAEIKRYSQWPTIPMLYVQGELVGGESESGT